MRIKIDEKNAYRWLAEFVRKAPPAKATRLKNPAQAQHNPSTPQHETSGVPAQGRTEAASLQHYTREKDVSLVSNDLTTPVGVVATSEPPAEPPQLFAVAPPAPKPEKAPKPLRLGLDTAAKAEAISARTLCDRLWHLLESTDNKPRATTKTGWAQQQMRVARELVRAGVTPERFEAELAAFREARGYYPRMFKWLQEFMERRPSDGRPPKPRLEAGETCFWDEDRWRIESPNDPKPMWAQRG